jgi:hypothetical protein
VRAGLVAALAAAALASGCSSDGGSGPTTPDPAVSDAADVAWNPCDGLTAAQVGRLAGEELAEQTGTAAEPRCTFTPVAEGGPAYDVSYLWFDGGLDAALDAMGTVGTQLRPVDVPGADAARLAVRARPSGVLVTGFVQTDGLVQSVNAVQLKPYDERRVVASTRHLLAALVRGAPSSPPE